MYTYFSLPPIYTNFSLPPIYWTAAAPVHIALVQWTHTLRMKNSIRHARAQLAREDRFGHHVRSDRVCRQRVLWPQSE